LTRGLLGGLVAALGCSLLLASPTPARAAPPVHAVPHNPSDKQIAAAKEKVRQRAAAVGRLTAAVASKDAEIKRLRDLAELAMEKYNQARADLVAATGTQRRTAVAAAQARTRVAEATKAASGFVRASYIAGSAVNSYATLLSAHGPSQLLQQAEYLRYASAHQLDVLGRLGRATVGRANADSAARAAVRDRGEAAARATRARLEAIRRVSDAHTQLVSLTRQKAALNTQLTRARVQANGLVAERTRYRAWQHAVAVAAARERARQEALRRRAAAARAGSPGWTGNPGGSWSPAKGEYVAQAALRWLGVPYAWGGGTYSGPSYGVNGPGAGFNDGAVYGFDCSGLAMWGWAQVGIYLPHYSGYQYGAGSDHPSAGDLRPGDLVFWSYDGTAGGIHHVAIYLGGGQIVQAPESGDVVKISTMWFDGYFGAVRPGT
jgi:cell wall-associated NlpC family hydrolase